MSSTPRQVHDRLCAALAAAADGDLDTARATFQDRVHGPLHCPTESPDTQESEP